MEITLVPYTAQKENAADMLIQFWQEQGLFPPSPETASEDLSGWTKDGHSLHLIHVDGTIAGFVHLVCPKGTANCRLESFLLLQYRGRGADSLAVSLAEDLLKDHYKAQYPDADQETLQPHRIYQEIGYCCPAALEGRKTFRLGSRK